MTNNATVLKWLEEMKELPFVLQAFMEEIGSDELGINVGMDEISKIVGKNNMFIKTHPRSPNNRFIERGYNTNLNSSIPWEVICLNTDLSKTVLITLSSQSVFTPMFLLNKKTTSIIMFNMLNDKSMIYMDSALFIEEKGKQFDTFFNFNSIEQLKKKLKEIKGEIS